MARRAYCLDTLRAQLDARFTKRDIRSDGWIGDKAHASRKSDHNPNTRGVVQAIDVDEHTDTSERSDEVGRWLVESLRTSQDPRIKYVVYEGRMFSCYPARGVPPWTWRNGNGHTQHVHVSVVDDPTLYDDDTPFRLGWGTYAPTSEDDDMTPEQAATLDWISKRVGDNNHALGRMEKVHGQGLVNLSPGGDVNVDELAAALSQQLGTDLARTLGRILSAT
jgi:hypothetical protein